MMISLRCLLMLGGLAVFSVDGDSQTISGDCGWMDCSRPSVWPCQGVHHPEVCRTAFKKNIIFLDFGGCTDYWRRHLLQEQGRPGEPQGLLVRHIHAVQRVWDGGEWGEAERRSQWELGRGSGLQQQAAHHGVFPQTRAQADHHGWEVHAAAQKSGLQGDWTVGQILKRSVFAYCAPSIYSEVFMYFFKNVQMLPCRCREEEFVHAVSGVGAVTPLQPRRVAHRHSYWTTGH